MHYAVPASRRCGRSFRTWRGARCPRTDRPNRLRWSGRRGSNPRPSAWEAQWIRPGPQAGKGSPDDSGTWLRGPDMPGHHPGHPEPGAPSTHCNAGGMPTSHPALRRIPQRGRIARIVSAVPPRGWQRCRNAPPRPFLTAAPLDGPAGPLGGRGSPPARSTRIARLHAFLFLLASSPRASWQGARRPCESEGLGRIQGDLWAAFSPQMRVAAVHIRSLSHASASPVPSAAFPAGKPP